MKKQLIFAIILFLLFSASSGLIYLNNFYLPVKIKGKIIAALETSLNYNADIQKIKYNLFKGLVIQDLTVYDQLRDKENTLFSAKEVSFQFLFLPLLKERKIIIPVIHIDSPFIYIRYQKDNNFNFSRIFNPPKQKTAQKMKFSFLVYKAHIFNGECVFRDDHPSPEFNKTLRDLSIGLKVSPPAKLSFLIQGRLLTEQAAFTNLSGQGEYNILSRELEAKLNLVNLIIPEFNHYLKDLPFSINTGSIENADLGLKLKDRLISLSGALSTKGLELKKDGLGLSGNIDVEPSLSYGLDKKALDYKINFRFIQANFSGIPYIEKVSNISGDMGLVKNRLWADNLKIQILDSPFALKAACEDFANPVLKADLTCEQLNLEKLLALLPSRPQGINLSGTSKAEISIEGFVKKLPLDIKANLQLSNAKLEAQLLKEPVNNIKGRIDLAQDELSWSDLSFDYLNTPYSSSGKWMHFKEPRVNFVLASKDLDLKSDFGLKDNIFKINSCLGKYAASDFDIKGNIDIQDKTNPLLNLSGKLNLKTEDALVFLPKEAAEKIKKIKPEGMLNIAGRLNGKAKDYKDWDVSLKNTSEAFSVYNLKLENLSFGLAQKNGILNIAPFSGSSYGGLIKLDFSADLKSEAQTYSLKLGLSGIDLAKLKADTGLKDQDLSGILEVNADVNGSLKDAGLLKGAGELSVKNGNLWKLNLFKGLGELFLLPDYEKIIFQEAEAEFNIADKAIYTENLKLASGQLNLDCRGKLGFDGGLDFTVYTQVNQNLLQDSSDIRKFTSAILGELSSAVAIKVSGTIRKPKYSLVPMATDLIKNIKDFLLGK